MDVPGRQWIWEWGARYELSEQNCGCRRESRARVLLERSREGVGREAAAHHHDWTGHRVGRRAETERGRKRLAACFNWLAARGSNLRPID
jgi:hypothetical protein